MMVRPVDVRAVKTIPAPTVSPVGNVTCWPSWSAELPPSGTPYAVTASSRSIPNEKLPRCPAASSVMCSYAAGCVADPEPRDAELRPPPMPVAAPSVNGKPCCQNSGLSSPG